MTKKTVRKRKPKNPLRGFFPSGRAVVIEKRTINPDIADALLTNSEVEFVNRSVNDNNVAALSRAIVKGDWNVDGNTIKIDKKGVVYDGQHRLWAIIDANKSITTYVLFNGTRDHAVTMDQGKSRSFADWLVMNKYSNTSLLQALVNTVLRYNADQLLRRKVTYTVPELVAEFKANEQRYLDAAHNGNKCIGIPGMVRSHAALIAYVNNNAPQVLDFIDQVKRDAHDGDHPCYALRSRLLRSRLQTSRTHTLTLVEKLALTIKAWNAYATGRTLTTLKWVRWGGGRVKPEPMPRIVVVKK